MLKRPMHMWERIIFDSQPRTHKCIYMYIGVVAYLQSCACHWHHGQFSERTRLIFFHSELSDLVCIKDTLGQIRQKAPLQTMWDKLQLDPIGSVWILCAVCVLKHVAVGCSVLQWVAVCCSVLQCVAVCCSVLQCVAVWCSLAVGVVCSESCALRMYTCIHVYTYVCI